MTLVCCVFYELFAYHEEVCIKIRSPKRYRNSGWWPKFYDNTLWSKVVISCKADLKKLKFAEQINKKQRMMHFRTSWHNHEPNEVHGNAFYIQKFPSAFQTSRKPRTPAEHRPNTARTPRTPWNPMFEDLGFWVSLHALFNSKYGAIMINTNRVFMIFVPFWNEFKGLQNGTKITKTRLVLIMMAPYFELKSACKETQK